MKQRDNLSENLWLHEIWQISRNISRFFSHENICKAGAAVFAIVLLCQRNFRFNPYHSPTKSYPPPSLSSSKAMTKISSRPLSFGLFGIRSLLLPVRNALRSGVEGWGAVTGRSCALLTDECAQRARLQLFLSHCLPHDWKICTQSDLWIVHIVPC